MYTVYVLRSKKDDNLYVGCTSNLTKRLAMHSKGQVLSIKSRLPVILIYSEKFEGRHKAFFTERYYKTANGKRDLKKKIYCGIV